MKRFIMSPYLTAVLIVLILGVWVNNARAEGAPPSGPYCDDISRQEGVCNKVDCRTGGNTRCA